MPKEETVVVGDCWSGDTGEGGMRGRERWWSEGGTDEAEMFVGGAGVGHNART